MLGRQARPAGDGGLLDGIEAMSLPLKWIAVGAPGDRHGAMITRQLEGEDAGATAVRVALTLFPDELIITLRIMGRSEEHTSELQSLMRISYAVFCLKKTKTI